MKTLTTLEKTMNMQKLGTVSAFLPHFNNLIKSIINNALYVIVYTLCVIRDQPSRNRNRNGLAFDIPRISGQTALSRRSVSQSGFYVIPGLTPTELFQLNQLVRVPCNTRTLCHGWLTPRKPASILAYSLGTFYEMLKTVPAWAACWPWGAFDLGTSPHGLFASVSRSHQETSGKAGERFPAKPVLTVGELPPVKRSGRGVSALPTRPRRWGFTT